MSDWKVEFFMNESRKVKYTRKVIKQSFLSLLMERPIGKITVAEICKLADVHRGTFYQHYHDVYHLLEVIEEELYKQFEEMLPILENSMTSITSVAVTLIYNEQDVCRAILGEHGDTRFLQRVLNLCRQSSYNSYAKIGINEKDSQVIYTFVTSGCVGIILSWVNTGFKESADVVMSYIERLTQSGMSDFMNK